MEKEIGKVTHFFNKIGVAALNLSGSLSRGDSVRLLDEKRGVNFTQTVDSIQVDRKEVENAEEGTDLALKVEQPVHEGTKVLKISP